MAHPLPLRGGPAADEPDHRLAEAPPDHFLGRRLLVAATDLTDQDHRPGGAVVFEEGQDLLEGESQDRITADAHRGGLSYSCLAQPLADFVGESPAACPDPYRTFPVDVVRE